MKSFRDFVLQIITPKRALIDYNYLINRYAILNFSVGILISAYLTACYHLYGTMFLSGNMIGLGGSLLLMVKYFHTYEGRSVIRLNHINNVHFYNNHSITKDPETKCCGTKAQFCGWVFGVSSSLGLKEKVYVKQEMHAAIKGKYLVLSIPSPRLSRKVIQSNFKLTRDMFEYRRVVSLLKADIVLQPTDPADSYRWGLKSPIEINVQVKSHNDGSNHYTNNWRSTHYAYFKSYVQSKISMLQCTTRPRTLRYITLSRQNPSQIFLCFVTCPDKEIWFRNLKMASYNLPVNPSMWQIIQPFLNKQSDKRKKTKESGVLDLRLIEFTKYMAKYMPNDWVLHKNRPLNLKIERLICNPNFLWINAITGRIFWDLIERGTLKENIIKKIHMKIRKMHLPVYIEDIEVDSIDIGYNMPIISGVERPVLDTLGWWCDINIYYNGGLSMSIATKVDLMKLRDQPNKSYRREQTSISSTSSPFESSKRPSSKHRYDSNRTENSFLDNASPEDINGIGESSSPRKSKSTNFRKRVTQIQGPLNPFTGHGGRRRRRHKRHPEKYEPDYNFDDFEDDPPAKLDQLRHLKAISLLMKKPQKKNQQQQKSQSNNLHKPRNKTPNHCSHLNNSQSYNNKKFKMILKKHRLPSLSSSDQMSQTCPAAFNSEEEDSADSINSEDEDYKLRKRLRLRDAIMRCIPKKENQAPKQDENKVFKFMEAVGRSKYFQKATQNKYVKQLLELFANKKIMLQLEVHHFKGTLVIHFPRPPTDRIWYGLRPHPDLNMTMVPQIGERKFNFAPMMEWIQKKVQTELQSALVLPNMDSFCIPEQTF